MDAMARVWRKIPGVKENCYAEWFFEQLWGFRFEGHLVDVTLCAEGREIPCHRLVLSACTDYFKAMFSGAHSESKKDKIEIGGVSGEALERLVDFAYTFRIHISSDNVQPLFEAANMLQIKYVEESCEEFLEKKLGPNTCLRTWALADKLSYPHLSALARSYALKKFEKVCRTEEFLQLPVRFLKVYISDEGLHARQEERVLEAVMRWARDDLKERQRHLEELLACVSFSCMDQSSLEKIIETDPVLSEVPGIKELINDRSRHARPRMIQQEEIIVLAGSRGVSPIESGANESIYRLNLHCDVVDSKLMPRMPRSLRDSEACAVCVVNNDIILTGGTVSPSQAVRYNSSRNSWIKLPSLRKGRLWHGMAAVNGQVYVVGGQNPGNAPRRNLSSVEVYTKGKRWKKVKPLKAGVSNFGITACCDKIYVFGGEMDPMTTIQCYDPIQNEWTIKAMRLGEPALCVRACTINSKIYLVGGRLPCVIRYDPQFDLIEEMAERVTMWNQCSATVCGSEIYITGGLSKPFLGIFPPHIKVQCYDVSTNTMSMGSLKSLPVPLFDHHTVTVSKHHSLAGV